MKRRSKPVLLSLLLFSAFTLATGTVSAQNIPSLPSEEPPPLFPGTPEHLAKYGWDHLAPLPEGEEEHRQLVSDPSVIGKVLKITNPGKPGTPDFKNIGVPLLIIDAPPITRSLYMVYGQVRYEAVQGQGYLEMWSHFPDGRSFFSRTLGTVDIGTNPMSILAGTIGDYRAFALPFDARGSVGAPRSLTINLMLPPGTIYLKELQLCQYAPPAPSATPVPVEAAGDINNPGMSVPPNLFGLLAATGGLLAALLIGLQFLAQRQRGRAFVFGATWTLIASGFVLLGMGLAGYLSGWPLSLWVSLLVVGGTVSLVFGSGLRFYHRAYHAGEWRRMAALDA